MSIYALTRCHYGSDYLNPVIRSTEGFADKHIIIYTPVPTFGRNTDIPNPDTRDRLLTIAQEAAGRRLHWIEGRFPDVMVGLTEFDDVDLLLECDADEIPHHDLLTCILDCWQQGEFTHRRYDLPMIHHWRSFGYICRDSQTHVRLRVPNAPIDDVAQFPRQIGRYVHHFGYARNTDDMLYKLAISLHNPEFRPGWWENVYCKFPDVLTDLHPVSVDMWNAEPFDLAGLPGVLINHPYRDMAVIE